MFYEGDKTQEEKQFETYCDQLDTLLCELLPKELLSEPESRQDFSVELKGEDKTPRWVSYSIEDKGDKKIRTVIIAKLFGEPNKQGFFMETSKVEIIEEAQKKNEPLLFITAVFNETTLVKESMQTPEYDPKKMDRLLKFLPQLKAQPLGQVRKTTRAALQKVQF